MSTIPTPIDRIRAASARRASVRWTLRVLRWVLTLAVTFIGLLAVTFVIGHACCAGC